jgi:XTP/dITP diphosphohydrolase
MEKMVKTKILELLEVVEKDLELSNWSRNLSLKDQHNWFLEEVEELKQAMEKGDMENYHEELGDLLWDLLKLMLVAEKEKNIEARKAIEQVIEKITVRKPHLWSGEKLTPEEEEERWLKTKEKLKNERPGNHR